MLCFYENYRQAIFCEHTILTEGGFVAQLCSNAVIFAWQCVWLWQITVSWAICKCSARYCALLTIIRLHSSIKWGSPVHLLSLQHKRARSPYIESLCLCHKLHANTNNFLCEEKWPKKALQSYVTVWSNFKQAQKWTHMLSVLPNLTQTQLLLVLLTLNLAFGLGWAMLASSIWDTMRTKHTNKPPLLQELKTYF